MQRSGSGPLPHAKALSFVGLERHQGHCTWRFRSLDSTNDRMLTRFCLLLGVVRSGDRLRRSRADSHPKSSGTPTLRRGRASLVR